MRLATLLLALLLILIGWSQIYAQAGDTPGAELVILTDDQQEYPLGLHLEILEDPAGELTIQDVSSPELESQFTPSRSPAPSYGFTDSAYWVRFRLDNQSRQSEQWMLELAFANMQFVDLYIPMPDGEGFTVRQTGALRPASTRDLLYPHIVFDLSVPIHESPEYFLRFQSGTSMTLPLTLSAKDSFLATTQHEQMLFGLFYGVLIGLLIYNLFLLISLREASYLYHVTMLAATTLFLAGYDGYAQIYLLPNHLEFLYQYYLPLTFALISVSAVLFADTFLEVKAQFPRLHWLNIVVLGVWVVLMFLTPFVTYRWIASLMASWTLVSLAMALIAGILTLRKDYRTARFYMFAWAGLLITLLLIVLVRVGFIPSTMLTENAFRPGMVWLALCWSIALADRINQLKNETQRAYQVVQSNEHRLSQILEGLPLGVVMYGKDRRPSYVNRRVAEILSNPVQGIGPDPNTRRDVAEAMDYYSFQVTGSNQKYPLEKFPVYRALQGEPASADDIEADLVDKRVPLEIWASPLRDDAGAVEAALVAFQDITLRKRTEAELIEYRKHLESLVADRTAELSASNDRLYKEISERETVQQLLQQHIIWLTTLNQVRQTISGAADLGQAYEQLAASIAQLLDAGEVFLLGWADGGRPTVAVCRGQQGASDSDLEAVASLFDVGSALRKQLEPGLAVRFSADQAASLPAPLSECFREDGFKSLVMVPMIIRQVVSGVLGVAIAHPEQGFAPALADLVDTMTQDLAELTENAHLLDQTQALITADERNRLARDLHDSVTQVLFSASLVAEVLPRIWRRNPERALQSLEELRQLTRSALADMRTMLLELRPSAVLKSPLPDLLAQLTEATTSRVRLPFQLLIEPIPPLPDDVHTTFYRIAQEALNNVVKHAQATEVIVSLRATSLAPDDAGDPKQIVTLVIEDDGVGFSPGMGWQEHLGMGSMRERAAAIKASYFINSRAGHGTRVTLAWPNPSEQSS